MAFFNDTNRKRVQKIVEIVHLLQKSGNANSIDREQMWDLLEPAINAIGDAIGEDPQKPSTAAPGASQGLSEGSASSSPSAPPRNEQKHMTIKRMAEEASLKDLTVAMAVYLNRIDEELHK